MKFKFKQSKKDGRFYFVLVGGNGNPEMTSKMYKRKWNALRTLGKIASQFKNTIPILDLTA